MTIVTDLCRVELIEDKLPPEIEASSANKARRGRWLQKPRVCINLEDVWCQCTFRTLCRRKIYTYWRGSVDAPCRLSRVGSVRFIVEC